MNLKIFKSPLPYLALLIAHLIWGANFVIVKVTLEEIPVMTMLFLRFFFAFLLLLPFLVVHEKKERRIKFEDITKFFLVGLLLIVFNNAFGYEGLNQTSAINASTLTLIIPILSVVGGWWFLKEKIYWINLMGVVAGLLGGLTLIGLPLIFIGGFPYENLIGNMMILISGMFFVAGSIISRGLLKLYKPMVVTAGVFFVGAVSFFIPAVIDYINDPLWVQNITVLGILGMIYITIMSTICAYLLITWGLLRVGVIKTNLFHYIEPAIAATIAVPLLGERISYSFIIGTCLVVLGVYWGTLGKSEHHHTHNKHHRM